MTKEELKNKLDYVTDALQELVDNLYDDNYDFDSRDVAKELESVISMMPNLR